MYNTAKEILKDLNRTGILNVLLCPTSEYWNYRLVLSGHSLGAGAVSVLALLLRPAFPDLVCFAYSTPGCIFRYNCIDIVSNNVQVDLRNEKDIVSFLSVLLLSSYKTILTGQCVHSLKLLLQF